MWCIAWWHSGRDDEDDDDDGGGPEASSRTFHGYEGSLTPVSRETPFTVSRGPSDSGAMQSSTSNLNSSRSQTSGDLAIRSLPKDSVSDPTFSQKRFPTQHFTYEKKTIQNYSKNQYLKLLKTIVTIHQCYIGGLLEELLGEDRD